MLASRFPRTIKEFEEEALFLLAEMICLKKAGIGEQISREAFGLHVRPLLEGKVLHASRRENRIAFAMLGAVLSRTAGSGRFLPQTSPHWLAFRRLFLNLCDHPLPASVLNRGIFAERHREIHRAQVQNLKAQGMMAEDVPEELVHPWESKYLPELPRIKKVTQARLDDYSRLTFKSVKDHFVDHGTVSLEPECGALYEVVQNIAWDHVPRTLTLEESGISTLTLLQEILRSTKPDLNFDAEYSKAVRSVRAVLFDVAAEEVLGVGDCDSKSVTEVENLFCQNRLLDKPFSLLSDDRVVNYVAEGIGTGGSFFLKKLVNQLAKMEAHRDRNSDSNDPKISSHRNSREFRKMVARFWLNKDWPLWLMEVPVIVRLLKPISPHPTACTRDTVKNLITKKPRLSRSLLAQASMLPITDRERLTRKTRADSEPLAFVNDVGTHPLYERLRRRVRRQGKLSIGGSKRP